jgi:hypothetical protein
LRPAPGAISSLSQFPDGGAPMTKGLDKKKDDKKKPLKTKDEKRAEKQAKKATRSW